MAMLDKPVVSPKIGPKEVIYEDAYFQLFRVTADFGEIKKEYVVRDSGKRVGILVVRENEALLVRQYRLLINGLSWEIPGGKVNAGEEPVAAAMRECQEETGVRCGDLNLLLTFQPGLDTLYNPTYLFYTEGPVEAGIQSTNPYEAASHEWVPLECCFEMIFQERIVDSLSIVALLSYRTAVLKK